MILNKKPSCIGAWKALYVLLLVGTPLVVNALTKFDYHSQDSDLNGVVLVELMNQQGQELSFGLNEVEHKPSFNGGDVNEFVKWVAQNITYPEEAKKNNVKGRVVLSFVVGSDGEVRDAKVLRGVDPSLDAEALRVVSSSPKWSPASHKGKAVAVSYVIPFVFK